MTPRRSVFYLAQMCCSSEERLVRKNLSALPGVRDMTFNLMEKRLTISHSYDSEAPLLESLQRLGMEPSLKQTVAPSAWGGPRLWLAGLLAVAAEFSGHGPAAAGLALASIALGGLETLRRGWLALRSLTLNINFLMSSAVLGALALGHWAEAAMVTFLFGLAEKLEGASLQRARNALRQLLELSPEQARVLEEGREQMVPAASVQPGQTLRVKPGERIPLDGTVCRGASSVNQAAITGESASQEKGISDPVYAGTINELGTFDMAVTAGRGHTTLDRIVAAVQTAQEQQAPTQRLIDRFARYYTPLIFALACAVAVLPPLVWQLPAAGWIYRGLTLLVVGCPCALVLSTPVTVVSALAAAARCGILVKGGAFLESGCKLRVLALDKTGTLTEGRPAVSQIRSLSPRSVAEVTQLLASLENHSEHPIAGALVKHWSGPVLEVDEFAALPGWGVRGRIAGKLYQAGSRRLLETQPIPETTAGTTVVYLLEEGELIGLAELRDQLRADASEALAALREQGILTVMLTGDSPEAAAAVAKSLPLDEVRAGLLPEEKLMTVDELAAHGPVAMVGDGINDAPALARASLGFAMGQAGTAVALETADIALMNDRLSNLPHFVRLSRRTRAILIQNIFFALVVKLVFCVLTALGHVSLWMAILADMGSCLLVIANGLRLLRFPALAPLAPKACCSKTCCSSKAQ